MNTELIAILVTGILLALEIGVSFFMGLRWLREAIHIERAVAGLAVQESEKIQNLMRG